MGMIKEDFTRLMCELSIRLYGKDFFELDIKEQKDVVTKA